MEQSPAAMWTRLLRAGLVLAVPVAVALSSSILAPSVSNTTHPRTPELVSCVFQERANITCQWEPMGDPQITHYTLTIKKMVKWSKVFNCSSPSGTNCTVSINGETVRANFCINVTAHGPNSIVASKPRCQLGTIEIKLRSVKIEDVQPVAADPQCLSVSWKNYDAMHFAVSESEINKGHLESEIAFKAEGQDDFQKTNVIVGNYTLKVCTLRADTTYTVKVRHRYQSSRSPWSSWSNEGVGRTAENTPSSAPPFWRRVRKTEQDGRRLILLFWKPLPHFLANGIVSFYNVTCHTEAGLVLADTDSCRNLHGSSNSCSLHLPPGGCSCSLTASTSAGPSPKAWIRLRAAQDADLPPMNQMTVEPVNDYQLKVQWAAAAEPPASSFVVEWFIVGEQNNTIHWEHLNKSSTTLVISEGVEPRTRYTVSVTALYAEKAGYKSTQVLYSRQDVPSNGPKIVFTRVIGSTVDLSWNPVPVKDLHGFLQSYTIYYTLSNQSEKSIIVDSDTHTYHLTSLSPGLYNVYLKANTVAGLGEKGVGATFIIASEEGKVVTYVILVIMLATGILLLIACLGHSNIVKHNLYQDIPDPSSSSLSHWTLKPVLENMTWIVKPEKCEIKCPEVVSLKESELHTSESDQDFNYKTTCNLQMYSTHQYNSQPKTRRYDIKYMRTPTGANTSSGADFSSCPSLYTNILSSKTLPASLLPLADRDGHYGSVHVHVHDDALQPEGAYEHPGAPQTTTICTGLSPAPSQTDVLGMCPHLHGTLSFSSLCGNLHPSPLLSHLPNAASLQDILSQNRVLSAHHLELSTFSPPTNPPRTFTPFTQAIFLDFSHSPVECDPYISV